LLVVPTIATTPSCCTSFRAACAASAASFFVRGRQLERVAFDAALFVDHVEVRLDTRDHLGVRESTGLSHDRTDLDDTAFTCGAPGAGAAPRRDHEGRQDDGRQCAAAPDVGHASLHHSLPLDGAHLQ
jgi:hypothetical protein